MNKLAGVIGAVLAVAVLWALTEWLFVDAFASTFGDTLEVVLTAGAAVLGWIAGTRLLRRNHAASTSS